MRTEIKFATAYKTLQFMLSLHKKPYWIVPTESDYIVSLVAPEAKYLPKNTRAIQYDVNEDVINSVVAI